MGDRYQMCGARMFAGSNGKACIICGRWRLRQVEEESLIHVICEFCGHRLTFVKPRGEEG